MRILRKKARTDEAFRDLKTACANVLGNPGGSVFRPAIKPAASAGTAFGAGP